MKTATHIIAALIVAATTLAVQAAEEPLKTPVKPEHKAHYQRPYEPVGRTAFLRLPLGSVRPEGWLRDWCVAARKGVVGHPYDYPNPEQAIVFRKGSTPTDPGPSAARERRGEEANS